jgi:hypothetical protein
MTSDFIIEIARPAGHDISLWRLKRRFEYYGHINGRQVTRGDRSLEQGGFSMARGIMVGFSLLAWIVVAEVGGDAAVAQSPRHPKLHAALYELQAARKELKDSRDNFAGHRAKAILATDEAIITLKLMLVVKADFRLAERDADFYKRHKDNPRLRQAAEDLREARVELLESNDFGILKRRGLRDIDRAIEQIELVLTHVTQVTRGADIRSEP